MCGIFGITHFSDKNLAIKALKSFAYRGPDHTGYVQQDNVFLGNNRLSIIDLDERSNQPLFSKDETISIVFNGEIFNFNELRENLINEGYDFRTNSDTEVLIALYQTFGKTFVNKLRGMFVFAIFDKNLNQILVYRDHIGIKPLYYSTHQGRLVFSSELKGIAIVSQDLKLSSESFLLATTLGYVPAPMTIYENVFKLPAGALLIYNLAEKTHEVQEAYFQYTESRVHTIHELTELIEKKVLEHLVGDVPVGLFFSGGTDSSLIAAILKKHNVSLEAFSIIMSNKSEDEKYIDKIGNELKLKLHKEVFDTPEFDVALTHTRQLIDEPTLDSSFLALYHISKVASQKVKVVLSGEGADEFYFGYSRHRILAEASVPYFKRNSVLTWLYQISPISFPGKRRLFMYLSRIVKDFYMYYLVTTSDNSSASAWLSCKKLFTQKSAEPILLDQKMYLENDLLRKIDLATSYASIEGRVPFLDADVISASKNFYAEFVASDILKPTLKQILASYIPKELVYRNKSGLGLPVNKFFSESKLFKADFELALSVLRQKDEFHGLIPNISTDLLIEKSPYFSFLLLTYYYSIINTQKY